MLLQPDLLKTKESEMEWLGVASAGGRGWRATPRGRRYVPYLFPSAGI